MTWWAPSSTSTMKSGCAGVRGRLKAQGPLYVADALCRCDSLWVPKPLCHFEEDIFFIYGELGVGSDQILWIAMPVSALLIISILNRFPSSYLLQLIECTTEVCELLRWDCGLGIEHKLLKSVHARASE